MNVTMLEGLNRINLFLVIPFITVANCWNTFKLSEKINEVELITSKKSLTIIVALYCASEVFRLGIENSRNPVIRYFIAMLVIQILPHFGTKEQYAFWAKMYSAYGLFWYFLYMFFVR